MLPIDNPPTRIRTRVHILGELIDYVLFERRFALCDNCGVRNPGLVGGILCSKSEHVFGVLVQERRIGDQLPTECDGVVTGVCRVGLCELLSEAGVREDSDARRSHIYPRGKDTSGGFHVLTGQADRL